MYVCPPTSFPSTTTNTCSPCDGSCTYCFGPTINNCTGCITGMVLYNFTCTINCPTGYTLNQWNVCFEQILYAVGLGWAALALLL
jgi:proprotein convertase subtilisin/kexin type 5